MSGADGLADFERWREERTVAEPMIPDASVDVVISNCVLNLVDPAERAAMLSEVFRVLKKGGRAAISDVVCDEDVPQDLQDDPELWAGCVSGAWRDDLFCC